MYGQKDVLHDVVGTIGSYVAPSCDVFDKRHALAQQFLIGSALASLGGHHQSRPMPITFRDSLVCNRLRHCPFNDFRLGNGATSMSSQSGGIDAK